MSNVKWADLNSGICASVNLNAPAARLGERLPSGLHADAQSHQINTAFEAMHPVADAGGLHADAHSNQLVCVIRRTLGALIGAHADVTSNGIAMYSPVASLRS